MYRCVPLFQSLAADPLSEDWLICGGGPQLANWHLAALRPTTTFEYEASAFAQRAIFHDDQVVSVGSDHVIRHWHLNGQSHASVPARSGHGMDVLVAGPPLNEEEEEEDEGEEEIKEHVLVCGSSSRIDVCSKLGYVVFSLEL